MIKNLFDDNEEPPKGPGIGTEAKGAPTVIGRFGSLDEPGGTSDEPVLFSAGGPESAAETVRRSGLAWSMGVVFVVSVVFLLVLGWGADLLFGSSPWGMVAGIVIGSLIGFYQLFRLSSQILKK